MFDDSKNYIRKKQQKKGNKINDDITLSSLTPDYAVDTRLKKLHQEKKPQKKGNKIQIYNTIFAGFGHILRPFNSINYFY